MLSFNWGRVGFCFAAPTASAALSAGFAMHWALGLLLALLGIALATVVVMAEHNRFKKLSPERVRSFRAEDFRRSGFFFLEL